MNSRLAMPKRGASRVRAHPVVVAFLLGVLAICVLSATASARFTRPLLCRIEQKQQVSPENLEGLAVDAGDHLWAGESYSGSVRGAGPSRLYEFEPAYSSCGDLAGSLEINGLAGPGHLAIDDATGDFYVTSRMFNAGTQEGYVEVFDSAGNFVERWGPQYAESNVAVDNSTDPLDSSSGSVYVTHWEDPLGPAGDGLPPGVGKFDAKGNPAPFTGSGAGPAGSRCEKYVTGNQLLGTPGECFRPEGATVDSEGNIYVLNGGTNDGEVDAVDEFSPAGVFERAFTGSETPGVPGVGGSSHIGNGGFGGRLVGVAFDPASGHLLVTVDGESSRQENESRGVVDEFDAATGRFLDQISTTSAGMRLHHPLQMAADSHGDVYVLDNTRSGETEQEHALDVYGPGRFLPTLTLGEATARTSESAEVSATVSPEGFALSECAFEYVTEAAFQAEGFADLSSGGSVPCAPAAASLPPNATTSVHAKLSGLASGVVYRYRIVAKSTGALGGSNVSQALAFTALHAPRVDSDRLPISPRNTPTCTPRSTRLARIPAIASSTWHRPATLRALRIPMRLGRARRLRVSAREGWRATPRRALCSRSAVSPRVLPIATECSPKTHWVHLRANHVQKGRSRRCPRLLLACPMGARTSCSHRLKSQAHPTCLANQSPKENF